jgi:hypothetical protein
VKQLHQINVDDLKSLLMKQNLLEQRWSGKDDAQILILDPIHSHMLHSLIPLQVQLNKINLSNKYKLQQNLTY